MARESQRDFKMPAEKIRLSSSRNKNNRFQDAKNKKSIKILKISGPLAAPSANREGHKPAKNIKEAKEFFGNKIFYLDRGNLVSKPSKLVDLTGKSIKILRR